jgi:enoyl-CoA hydratase
MAKDPVLVDRRGHVTVVMINRPESRNAVDRTTAEQLAAAFCAFESDASQSVAVLTGSGGTFCAGADLKAIAAGRGNRVEEDGDGPMGPTRMQLSKPVIAAVEGHAVAGGLELALWCDMRVAAEDAVFGVFCRRFGVPLADGGTVRLPRLIGQSHALDLILTGRGVCGVEARAMGLANRLVPKGEALAEAVRLAEELTRFPQQCLRSDRRSVLAQWSLSEEEALRRETRCGLEVIGSGETRAGAEHFSRGIGRHGKPQKGSE